MAEKFITIPTADLDVNNLPTTLNNAVLHATTSLSGLTNGTEVRAFVLQNPSDAFTPEAAAASLTYIDSFGFSDQSFTSTPSFSVDLSSALAGDKIMVVYSNSAALADMHATLTIGGNSAGAAVASRGGLSTNRSCRVWEYTMPANGSAGTTFALSGGVGASTNLMGVLIVRGGTVVSTGHVQNSSATSLSTTITPANANNIIFACRFGFGSMGTVAWTSTITTTDFYVDSRITGGYVEDVAAGSPLTVTVTNSSSRTGSLLVLSVEPV